MGLKYLAQRLPRVERSSGSQCVPVGKWGEESQRGPSLKGKGWGCGVGAGKRGVRGPPGLGLPDLAPWLEASFQVIPVCNERGNAD